MTFKDHIYKNIDTLGLPHDISYQTLINIEEMANDWYKSDGPKMDKDLKKLVELSMTMMDLLKQCRNNKLPMKLAKQIDNLIKEISYLE